MSKTFFALKLLCFIICAAFFVILMKDVWLKYSKKMISSRTNTKFDLSGQKMFPCLTFCVAFGFRNAGIHFTKLEFMRNTFGLDDIFTKVTESEIQNVSRYRITETKVCFPSSYPRLIPREFHTPP
jgi:hypothetical protein